MAGIGRGVMLAAALLAAMPATAATVNVLANVSNINATQPRGSLVIDAAGTLYGTTHGSTYGRSVVYSLSSNGTLAAVADLEHAQGRGTYARLTMGPGGTLFGVTSGGSSQFGRVFSVTSGGALTTLHQFNGINGANPIGGMAIDAAGTLYGTTNDGGLFNQGSIFRLTSGGSFTTLHSFNFNGFNGFYPTGDLIIDAAGTMYGTTYGATNFGSTVFRLTSSGSFTTLASFNPDGSNGRNPYGGLVMDAAGTLYGTTRFGGANDMGTLFSLTSSGVLTTLLHFDGSNGAEPLGTLILDRNGTLFGTASRGGANNAGTAFRLTSGGVFSTLANFGGNLGDNPYAGLIADAGGTLYGTTFTGTVFSISDSGFAAVPEPASWALLIAGFGLVGAAARRRRALA